MPEARIAVTSSSSFTVPRWYGSTSVIWEPRCIARPRSVKSGSAAMRCATLTTSSYGTPNLAVFSPVLVYGCVSVATSGFTRIPRVARRLARCATAMAASSSADDSMFR